VFSKLKYYRRRALFLAAFLVDFFADFLAVLRFAVFLVAFFATFRAFFFFAGILFMRDIFVKKFDRDIFSNVLKKYLLIYNYHA